LFGFGFLHERAGGLGGIFEGGIVFVNKHLRHDGSDVFGDAAPPQFVLKVLLQRVANRALRIRAADIEGKFMQPFGFRGDFGTAKDEPDLRAVLVPNGDIPSGFYHSGNVEGGFLRGLVLILHRFVGFVFDEGISANRDDGKFLFGHR